MKILIYTVLLIITIQDTLSQNTDNNSFLNKWTLKDFYLYDAKLEHQVDIVFNSLDDTARVAQMIITSAGELGKPENVVIDLAQSNRIGGVVFLKGKQENHKGIIKRLNQIAVKNNQPPLIFSIDAEPSLFTGRLIGSEPMVNTIDINTIDEADSIAAFISKKLLSLGFHQNFAPVVDVSPQNEAIKNRSFGSNIDSVVALSRQFILTTQSKEIVSTAKHFPGHGLVSGDTHEKSVYIDGKLRELEVYPPLIQAGVLSVMMAHITIRNNSKYDTKGLPASCSRNIVTGLLKDELGFKGLVITDALNIMKAVTVVDNAPLMSSKAGNDMLLMPISETETIETILAEMNINDDYRNQVYASVKKIIRLKICLGLIK